MGQCPRIFSFIIVVNILFICIWLYLVVYGVRSSYCTGLTEISILKFSPFPSYYKKQLFFPVGGFAGNIFIGYRIKIFFALGI